jgi:hypothetical protein
MQRTAACVIVLALASGAGLAAQTSRILIVADLATLQFCSTPRVRDLMRHAVQVARRNGDRVAIASTVLDVSAPLSADWNRLDSTISRIVGMGMPSYDVVSAQLTSAAADELRQRAAVSSSKAADALRSIAAQGSGPVIVLYFTDGYPAFIPEPTELIEEARKLDARFVAIDPRGIDRPGPGCVPNLDAYIAATRGSHRTLASQTNGSVVVAAGELDGALPGLGTSPLSR